MKFLPMDTVYYTYQQTYVLLSYDAGHFGSPANVLVADSVGRYTVYYIICEVSTLYQMLEPVTLEIGILLGSNIVSLLRY